MPQSVREEPVWASSAYEHWHANSPSGDARPCHHRHMREEVPVHLSHVWAAAPGDAYRYGEGARRRPVLGMHWMDHPGRLTRTVIDDLVQAEACARDGTHTCQWLSGAAVRAIVLGDSAIICWSQASMGIRRDVCTSTTRTGYMPSTSAVAAVSAAPTVAAG